MVAGTWFSKSGDRWKMIKDGHRSQVVDKGLMFEFVVKRHRDGQFPPTAYGDEDHVG